MQVTQHTLNIPEVMNPLVEAILANIGNECLEYYDKLQDASAFQLIDAKRAAVIKYEDATAVVQGAYIIADPERGIPPHLVLVAAYGTEALLFTPTEQHQEDGFTIDGLHVAYITTANIGFVHMMEE